MTKGMVASCFYIGSLLLFVGCNEREDTPQSEARSTAIEQGQDNLAGGWKAIEVTASVRELADYVVAEKRVASPVKDISNAASQVVSGWNYRFQMLLENGERWEAQVYVNTKKERSITTFRQITN